MQGAYAGGVLLVRPIVVAVAVLVASAVVGFASDPKERGKALVEELCAGCHAVGRTGDSPARGAPAFRTLIQRFGTNELMERMEQGLFSAHADMPTFHFKRDDARAVRVYLNSIQE